MARAIPDYEIDPFSRESVRNARAVDDALREFSPVLRLTDGTVLITRHADVMAGLQDWQSFSSNAQPWQDESVVMITDDPPRHTQVRQAIASILDARGLSKLRSSFVRDAQALLDDILSRPGEIIDAVRELTQPFIYKALPDAVGVGVEGREHMHAYTEMAFADLGPPNELHREAMKNLEPMLAWVDQCCDRNNLTSDGLGMAVYAFADKGLITEAEAKILVEILLSATAGTDKAIANTLRCFALFPEEYDKVRADPNLVLAAFEECLRWMPPIRMVGRVATREIDVGGYRIRAGQRVGFMIGAANRDPRAWSDPDRFDLSRDLSKSTARGFGVHACAGRAMARLEASVLLGEVANRVSRIELAGDPEPWMTTIASGPAKLPLRLYGA